MNRSADWLQQSRADLAVAAVNASAGHHEWACFACHQAVEKALKGLHLRHGQQIWGHGLGRSWRELPPAVGAALAAAVPDLDDRLPDGVPADHFGRLQSNDAQSHARSIVDAIAWACSAATAAATLAWAAIWICW